MTAALADLSDGDLLDEVDVLRRHQLETEVALLRVVAEFARQHGEATVDPVQSKLPGRERAVRLGGEGTPLVAEGAPLVAEFAPAVLAARLGLSAYAGTRKVADVLDLEYRLPAHWARVQALEVSEGHARYVARKTRYLTASEAAYVDARVAPSADGRVSWSRFEALVEAAIIAADPEAAAAREEAAARDTFAKTTRSTEHGIRGFYVRADFATIARIDATVAYLARALLAMGDTSTLDQRRVKAVLIMANPAQAVKILHAYQTWHRRNTAKNSTTQEGATAGEDTNPSTDEASVPTPERFDPTQAADLLDETKLLPTVWLFAHLAGSPVGRVEGAEPVTAEWVRRHLGQRCRFKITPVLDPLDQVPVDAYEIPDLHRQATHLLTPADIFPFAANTTRDMQIDHTIPWTKNERPRVRSSPGSGTTAPWSPSTTGSRPTADGKSNNPPPTTTSGATPTEPPTSSTTPAPADYPDPHPPRDHHSKHTSSTWHSPASRVAPADVRPRRPLHDRICRCALALVDPPGGSAAATQTVRDLGSTHVVDGGGLSELVEAGGPGQPLTWPGTARDPVGKDCPRRL